MDSYSDQLWKLSIMFLTAIAYLVFVFLQGVSIYALEISNIDWSLELAFEIGNLLKEQLVLFKNLTPKSRLDYTF